MFEVIISPLISSTMLFPLCGRVLRGVVWESLHSPAISSMRTLSYASALRFSRRSVKS